MFSSIIFYEFYVQTHMVSKLLKQFRMILRNNTEAFLSNLDGVLDVLIGQRSVYEVVVVAGKEDAAAYHFCDPFLMKNKAVNVGDS